MEVQTFMNIFRRAEKKNLTGNLTDEDMISAAVAEWCAVRVYDSINGDRAEYVRRGKGKNRKPKQVIFSFLECWRVLRNVDKFIDAAAASAAKAVAGSSSGSAQEGQRKRAYSAEKKEERFRGKRGKFEEPNIGSAAAREQRAL